MQAGVEVEKCSVQDPLIIAIASYSHPRLPKLTPCLAISCLELVEAQHRSPTCQPNRLELRFGMVNVRDHGRDGLDPQRAPASQLRDIRAGNTRVGRGPGQTLDRSLGYHDPRSRAESADSTWARKAPRQICSCTPRRSAHVGSAGEKPGVNHCDESDVDICGGSYQDLLAKK